jgi:COP9 signalosome complex subunit 4
VQPRAVSYEEQVSAIREQLAALYEGQEEWSKAAQALAGIDLDSGMRLLDAGGPGWHGLGLSGGAALGGLG